MQIPERYERQLREVRSELNKLEQFSFVNLVRELLKKKGTIIEEKLELAAIKELKLTESQLIREDLQDGLADIIYKINAVNEGQIERELAQTSSKKELWLMQHAPHIAVRLGEIVEQELLIKQLLTELIEATVAGKAAINALTSAGESLYKAKDLSTWDTFLGGGIIATALKHEELRISNTYLHAAQMALQRFQNELLDIQNMKQTALKVDIDGFVTFADYFFDDIFSAWSIHSKIATSQNQLRRVLDDVSNTILGLEGKIEQAKIANQKIQKEKLGILASGQEALFF